MTREEFDVAIKGFFDPNVPIKTRKLIFEFGLKGYNPRFALKLYHEIHDQLNAKIDLILAKRLVASAIFKAKADERSFYGEFWDNLYKEYPALAMYMDDAIDFTIDNSRFPSFVYATFDKEAIQWVEAEHPELL